jgi:hypothetical protein
MGAALTSFACGKKGPPLAPLVHIPAAVEEIAARRTGNDVAVTLTVPSKNIDGSVPIDIGRIEVFGYTGTAAPPRGRFLEVATLVGTVTVTSSKPESATPEPARPGEPLPGAPVTLTESLTPEALVAKEIPPLPETKRQPRPLPLVAPGATAAEAGPLRRFYFALAFSPTGRPGPPGTVAELRLTALPEAPAAVTATLVGDSVRVDWEPSGGLIGFLLDRSLPFEFSPLDNPPPDNANGATAAPDGPTRYNVYREIAAPISAAPPPADDRQPASPPASPKPPGEGGPSMPVLLNPAPLDPLTFSDPTSLDGRKRCYVVRSVRGLGPQAVEGIASEPSCLVPEDDRAPEPPTGLSATSDDGAITLIWEPNAEPDVAGYLVLRGEAGDATLTPATDTVVTEARYVDRTVKPGVGYVYAVQAIDTRLPRPNVSAASARYEVTAR